MAEPAIPGSAVALVYSDLGEHDAAIRWLQRAVDEYDPYRQFWSRDRRFQRLRADRRGKALFDCVEKLQ